jgi:hypothetical protein
MSITGCIILTRVVEANWVRYIPAHKQTGTARINERMVTYNELEIKGQNPKSPRDGNQLDPVISCHSDCCSKIGADLRYNPIPIISGIIRISIREKSIHPPATLSMINLFSTN